jgi:hypothetical protein
MQIKQSVGFLPQRESKQTHKKICIFLCAVAKSLILGRSAKFATNKKRGRPFWKKKTHYKRMFYLSERTNKWPKQKR